MYLFLTIIDSHLDNIEAIIMGESIEGGITEFMAK